MIQYILIGTAVAGAVWYLFRLVKKQFATSDKCGGGGCGCKE